MIISQTPMRISLVGGGTDMPAFYKRHDGEVISTSIDKYIYVSVNPRFDGKFRISYSRTEIADEWNDIQHDIVRETLKLFMMKGLEVVSISDIPGEGSGLGSSSAFTVGLLQAIYGMNDFKTHPGSLAETAFMVESKLCNHPVGKQDHYAAAYGGINHFVFQKKKVVSHEFIFTLEEWHDLNSRLMLFWTGVVRKAGDILENQSASLENNDDSFAKGLLMTELTRNLALEFGKGCFDTLGRCVRANWRMKSGLTDGITTDWIDDLISDVMRLGAEGAKICGAGGGGFLLVVADPRCHADIEEAVKLRHVPIKIGVPGSRIVYSEEG